MSRTKIALILAAAVIAGLFLWPYIAPVKITNSDAKTGTSIIAFGDSLTYGTGAARGEDFPSQLSKLIGREVINRGVPGETSGEALRRLDEQVLRGDPRIVIVFLGGNDILRRVPTAELFSNLDTIVARIQDKGAMVVLVGLTSLPFDQGYGSGYRELAHRRGCVLVPDALSDIIDNLKLKSDQVHPNGAGYKVIAERVAAALKPYL